MHFVSQALAALAVTLLAVSASGRPSSSDTTAVENWRFSAWISGLPKTMHDRVNSYRFMDGSVFEWAKNKLGFATAANSSTITTTTTTSETTEAPKVTTTRKVTAKPEEPERPNVSKTEYHDVDKDTEDDDAVDVAAAAENSDSPVPDTSSETNHDDTEDAENEDNTVLPNSSNESHSTNNDSLDDTSKIDVRSAF